jgi:addiction module RelE/StbE family toxin
LAFKIAYKNSVERDLKKIDKLQLKIICNKIESELSVKADKFPSLTGKFAGLRKFRVGDYRIIYSIFKDTVLILRVAHRKEAYK